MMGRLSVVVIVAATCLVRADPAGAQIDPLLFLKDRAPTIVFAVDSATAADEPAGWRASARASLAEAVQMNAVDASFGLLRTNGGTSGVPATSRVLVKADDPDANGQVLRALADPAALDPSTPSVDLPLVRMVSDLATEAARLNAAGSCTKVVAVLLVGGGLVGAGDGASSAAIAEATAPGVLFDVLAVAPGAEEAAELEILANRTGGSYVQTSSAAIDAAPLLVDLFPSPIPGTTVVPELTAAANEAVRQGLIELPGDADEVVVATPAVGTVDLRGAHDVDGQALPLTLIKDTRGNSLPQRDNVVIAASLGLPGFEGRLRASRAYKPVADSTRPSGYAFVSDGTRLWVGSVPAPDRRNLFTAAADGRLIPFVAADAQALAAIATGMGVSPAGAAQVIERVRALPLGPILDSRPVIMAPPALVPAPDADYARFAAALERRRSLVWVGTNSGVLECIDARLGVEVWGFIPPNLLRRLPRLLLGQAVTEPTLLMDGPVKVADVKIGGAWRTYLVAGEGAGGTFYQSLDVTLDGLANVAAPDSDDVDAMLAYFSAPDRIRLNWSFPKYADFDPSIGWSGDISAGAPDIEKTVGQSWSEPAVGRIGAGGPEVVLIGSGFLPPDVGAQPNRVGQAAGTTLYVLNAADGTVLASTTLDGVIQSAPVAVGPTGSRSMTKAYAGTLNGSVWRVEFGAGAPGQVLAGPPIRLWSGGAAQPIVGSMAAVDIGTRSYLFFGTGSDLLTSGAPPGGFRLVGLLDDGGSNRPTFQRSLEAGPDGAERPSAYPAVAGDVVFFTTSRRTKTAACVAVEVRLYGFTYVGGPAYDTTGDRRVDSQDGPLVAAMAGRRASAPIAVDRHLIFATGAALAVLGDPRDYGGAVAHSGIRVLSWRRASP